ncbi:DUF2321 domain-containing protein [Methylacidiphilum caldifontis]|uniref:DUF2321 domain-containing protein n=1 Tax=Methylacidiphilum caldifontis TaxID=2795386 RepID=UPI001A8C07D1|nr:DUF2321 domain-containing protein [Methylacidiphilum caldifontis]QSR89275.1 DUF2321 domain-containing protein [Methylacidiphilum caldifontis]
MNFRIPQESDYDVAQICLNGHLINDAAQRYPMHNKNYCTICGAKSITKCENCNEDIQGMYYNPKYITIKEYTIPSYCHFCGTPYPWTQTKIEAARIRIKEIESLSDEEKELLNQSINDLIKDTPKTNLAIDRVKRIMLKTKQDIAMIIKSIIADIAAESVKQLLNL